jgi:hypothetical protein
LFLDNLRNNSLSEGLRLEFGENLLHGGCLAFDHFPFLPSEGGFDRDVGLDNRALMRPIQPMTA